MLLFVECPASGEAQRMDQRGGPARSRALPDSEVREDQVPCHRTQRQHRDLRLGAQALPQVHGLQGNCHSGNVKLY